MGAPPMIKIDFYFPSRTMNGDDIPEEDILKVMHEISRKYGGSTRLEGKGKYIAKSGREETAPAYLLSIITEKKKATIVQDLQRFKEQIKTQFDQEAVLITYHDITEVR